MRTKLIILIVALLSYGCFGWAFVDSQNDRAHAKNDMPRCTQWFHAQHGKPFEKASTRECGCQLDGERFAYSPWP